MIVCLFYRKVIARCIDANEGLPEKVQGHLRNCAACRQACELEREVARRLVAGADRRNQSPPPFLRAKILASRRRGSEPAPPVRRFLRPIWAAALVIVALGLFSAALIRHAMESDRQIDRSSRTAQISDPLPAPPPPLRLFTTNAAQVASRNLSEWSHALDEPLEA